MEDECGDGFGGDEQMGERFHRNEAISAVQDEDPYLGEEDYEDYDDLYNDVNVGEGFLQQTIPPPGDVDKAAEQPPPQQKQQQQQQQLPQLPLPSLPPPLPVTCVTEKISIPGIVGEPKPPGPLAGGFSDMEYHRGPSEQVPPRPPPIPNIGDGLRPDMGQPQLPQPGQFGNPGYGNEGFPRPGGPGGGGPSMGMGGPPNYNTNVNGGNNAGGSGSGGTILFVGDLHWWTTDADLEAELCKYGQVKEVKFFDEKASGKSKGYCQVEFYDPMAAAACKDGMHGHLFNGRPCVVAFASPLSVRRMGEAQVSKNQSIVQQQSTPVQGRGRGGNGFPSGSNYSGRGGNWGRGGGSGARGQMGGNIRNRMGPAGGRGIMGNGGMLNPPPPPVLNPGGMFGQGFDPTGYGAVMGRMGAGFGGFPGGPAPPFPGMMPSFPPMVAPHVNPAFFGRGMAPGGVGMWPDQNVGGWGVEEQSSYGEDAASDHQYGEGSLGKDRMSDRDWSGPPDRKHRDDRERDMGLGHDMPDRRYHDDREMGREREREREKERDRDRDRERDRERERERDRHRDDRERHSDHHRHREREVHRDDEWDKGRSSRGRSKSREFEYSKRRRITPE